MMQDILPLAEQFISIPSNSNDPVALEKILDLALSHLHGFTIERFESHGVKSALIYTARTRPKKFKMILNGHLDVIPGKAHQYVPQRKGHRLYGVGSMDMKANVAAMIHVFKVIAPLVKYPLGLQLVTDEQTGGFHGTKYQIDQGVRSAFAIAGETTQFSVVNRAKGVLLLEVSCKGKAAHGAYPWKGDNAILKMCSFLRQIEEKFPAAEEAMHRTTVNISKISSDNQSFNKVPDDCTVGLDIRFIPEDAGIILQTIRTMMPKRFTLNIIARESALIVDDANPYICSLKVVVQQVLKREIALTEAQGTSDARHFTRVGCDGIEFGPIGGGIATDKEWVDIPSLKQYFEVLRTYLLSLHIVE